MASRGGMLRGLGFGGRLTAIIVSLVLVSVAVVASVVYVQYRASYSQAAMNSLQGTGDMNARSFMEWLGARQDEMRYLASLDAATSMDRERLNHLLERIAAAQGAYDTIFVVGADGRGVVGVAYDGRTRVLSPDEAQAFDVHDRAWFQQAIGGADTFSRPVISRATGSRVSTVALPIRRGGEVIGVMRGAVDLDTILQSIDGLGVGGQAEIYLVDREGTAVTPTSSVNDLDTPLDTQAANAIREGHSGVGRYLNAAGTDVVGSYSDIPLLGWGLVLETDAGEALAEVSRVFWTILLITFVVVLVALGVSLLVARSVTRRLGGEPEYAATVVRQVADGNLGVTVERRSGDDSSLLASIADMQESLRRMIGGIVDSSDQVASAATELSQVNEETESGVRSQNAQITEAATAMTEMTATVEEVARNTQSAADAAARASEEAESGRAVVSDTVGAIQKLVDELNQATGVMDSLKADSDSIGGVLQVIRNVSEQTNLLALNAAIEAARAGEHGRGFAVVADEVRTLASQTQKSTEEIQSMIERLQSRADDAVRVMRQSREGVERTASDAGAAGESLERISQAVVNINDMVQQIAGATEEQSATAQEINRNIHAVNDIAEQSAMSVNQSTEASESLARLAEELRGLVKRFRV